MALARLSPLNIVAENERGNGVNKGHKWQRDKSSPYEAFVSADYHAPNKNTVPPIMA